MKHKTILMGMAAAVLVLGFSGCGKETQRASDVAVTPQPTAGPTVAATATPTPTPAPTATPAPRLIGVKTDTAKKVLLTNNTNKEIREFYLKASYDEDWGKNLVPAESSIKASEQVQMYYTPVSGGSTEDSSDGTEKTKTAKSVFDIRLADGDGNTWEIYGAELSDMEKATIRIQEEDAYLTYMSISEKKQKDTRNNTASEDGDYDSEEYDSENDDEMYDTDQTDNSNYDYSNQDQQTDDNQNTDTDQTTDNSGNTNNAENSGNAGNTDNTDAGDNSQNTDNSGGSENDFSYEDSGSDVDYSEDTGDTGAGDDEFVWDESGEWG